MARKKRLTYHEKMVEALKKIPNPIEDKRHNIFIYFVNDQARSNQTRYEHLFEKRHGLTAHDIKHIKSGINKWIFKRDLERTDTFNIYIQRYSYSKEEYIKLSLHIDPRKPKRALVKTMFITRNVK